MPSPEEFYQFARESLAAAEKAVTEVEKEAFLQMARTWTQAAMTAQGTIAECEAQ